MKSIIPYILSLITIFCFQNCGTGFDVRRDLTPVYETDPTFVPHIKEFEYYYNKSTAHVPVAFGDLGENIAGVCYKYYVGTIVVRAYIKIDRQYWPLMSPLQQMSLVFHELGHCVLNRDHIPADSVRICPTSIMYDTVMSTWCLEENYDEYIKELFP